MAGIILYTGSSETPNIAGGMNLATSDFFRKSDEVLLSINGNGDRVGSIQGRPGYTLIGATLGASQDILGLQPYYQAGATRILIAGVNGAANASIAYSSGAAWSVINAGQLAGAKFMGEQYLNMAYFVGYNDSTSTFASNFLVNGTAYDSGHANLASMPQARYIKAYKDLLYVANVRTGGTNYPSRVYYSTTPTSASSITWTIASRYLSVPSDDNDPITGLEVNSDRLLIFKERSLYRWDESQVVFVSKAGCPNGRTIFTTDEGSLTFYYSLNGNGIYVYSGGKPKRISQKIQPIMDALDKSTLNQWYACGDFDHYYLYVGNVTIPLPNGDTQVVSNVVIVYTISINRWDLYSFNDSVRYMSRFVDTNNNDRVVFGNTNGQVFTLATSTDNVFSDNTAAIHFQVRYRFRTHWSSMRQVSSYVQRKIIHKVWPLVDVAQGMTFRSRVDNHDWSRDHQINGDAEGILIEKEGKVFEFEVSLITTTSPPILNSFGFEVEERGTFI